MRILFLTNFYPPHTRGGMELSCESVVDSLRQRGHQTLVLTSNYGLRVPIPGRDIARSLYLEMEFRPLRNSWDFFTARKKREAHNRATLRSYLADFKPDVVFVWGMWNLHRVLAQDAECSTSGRVLYRFGDYWPTLPAQYVYYWREPGRSRFTKVLKYLLRPLAFRILAREASVSLEYPHSYCISKAVKTHLLRQGVPIQQASVIYNGLDLSPFRDEEEDALRSEENDPSRLLFIGRLEPEKGPQIAIESLAHLLRDNNDRAWSLTLAGDGSRSFLSTLQALVDDNGISERVRFLGKIPPAEIPRLLRQHDILLVPSLWEEPFGRVVVEGMAAGRVVVASEIGALPELITHNETGFLFPPGDGDALTRSLVLLANSRVLRAEVAMRGREFALQHFDLDHMIDKVERTLELVAGGADRSRAQRPCTTARIA